MTARVTGPHTLGNPTGRYDRTSRITHCHRLPDFDATGSPSLVNSRSILHFRIALIAMNLCAQMHSPHARNDLLRAQVRARSDRVCVSLARPFPSSKATRAVQAECFYCREVHWEGSD